MANSSPARNRRAWSRSRSWCAAGRRATVGMRRSSPAEQDHSNSATTRQADTQDPLVGAGRYPPPPLFPLLLRQPATATLSTRMSRTAVTISRIRLMAHLLVLVSPPLISEKPGAPERLLAAACGRGR